MKRSLERVREPSSRANINLRCSPYGRRRHTLVQTTTPARVCFATRWRNALARVVLAVFLVLLLSFASTVDAAPSPQSTAEWTGSYFSNRNLQGAPDLTRQDAELNFSWGNAAPAPGLPADDFSVRWVRWLYLDTAGTWTFAVTADDGVRLFVDDELVIDAWVDQPPLAHAATISLTQAFHLFRVEYYDRAANAQIQFQMISASYPDWRGEYFGNADLSGEPELVRNDSSVNFIFGTTGPGGGISGSEFSVRWTRGQYFEGGRYRFTTVTDDGVRLWVDNQLLIDQWHDQTAKSWTGEMALADGSHLIRMEYFNHGGAGSAALTWMPVAGSTESWHGEFFNSTAPVGTAGMVREYPNIAFDWGTESPGTGIRAATNWSARFTSRRLVSLAGYYTVIAIADDGVRVYLDDNVVIDEWHDQVPVPLAATVYLNPGAHDWRVEYYQHGGSATLQVQIAPGVVGSLPAQASAGVDVIVDDDAEGFFKGGGANSWSEEKSGYGNHAYWASNSTFSQAQSGWARWYPRLQRPDDYEVFAYIPANLATTRTARYWIQHADGYDMRLVNQSLYADQWVSLGTFSFEAAGSEFVSLSDATFELAQTAKLAIDAVKFSPR